MSGDYPQPNMAALACKAAAHDHLQAEVERLRGLLADREALLAQCVAPIKRALRWSSGWSGEEAERDTAEAEALLAAIDAAGGQR